MALLLMAIPLLIADDVSAELVMDMDAVVWAQDAGPPLVVVAGDMLKTISREYTAAMSIQQPTNVSTTARAVRHSDAILDTPGLRTSLGSGNDLGRTVPAWRVGIVGAG